MRARARTALAAFIVLGVWGCSGQQDADDGDILADNNAGSVDDNEANESNNDGNNDADETDNESGADINNDTSPEPIENAPPVTNAGVNTAGPSAEPPVEPPPAEPANAQPAPSDAAPLPGGRVRYAKQAGVPVMSQPGGGSAIRTLNQGDHPVTWEENGFLKLANGMYVPVDAMSDQGIPRASVPVGH